jgi:ligand-binding SRPBCC domain-containing protein
MRIRIISTVYRPFKQVCEGFNLSLFKALLPPFGLVRLIRYEGQNPGDIIDLSFRIPFINNWTVIIKDSWFSHREYGFVDRGLRVPLGIEYWKHSHRVVARDNSSCFIIDDIEYESSWRLYDYILFPLIWFMFYPRKLMYGRYFKRLKNSPAR